MLLGEPTSKSLAVLSSFSQVGTTISVKSGPPIDRWGTMKKLRRTDRATSTAFAARNIERMMPKCPRINKMFRTDSEIGKW